MFDRFWAKVDARGVCWEWTAALAHGYGMFWPEHDTTIRAHRFAWLELVGPLADGIELDHLCKNRRCVNPDHLEPVSGYENNRRSGSPSALNMRKTECPRGHPYSEENTYVYILKRTGRPGRYCKTCHRERERRVHAVQS